MHPIIKITMHLLDDPDDYLLSETEHDLTLYEDAGGRLKAYVDYSGSILSVPVESAVLEAWLARERAGAMVP